MEASIDGYAQMRVFFSEDELAKIEELKRIDGEIWRFAKDFEPDKIKLIVYLRNRGRVMVFSSPQDQPWEEKTAYLIRLTPEAIQVMRNKQFVGLGPTDTRLRSVLMSLDSVY